MVRTLVTGRPELLAHSAGQPSPLHQAAFNGHVSIVRFLLDSGFPVNTRVSAVCFVYIGFNSSCIWFCILCKSAKGSKSNSMQDCLQDKGEESYELLGSK